MTYDDYLERCEEAIDAGEGDDSYVMSRSEWNRAQSDASAEDYADRQS
jgi:hypothetical protein